MNQPGPQADLRDAAALDVDALRSTLVYRRTAPLATVQAELAALQALDLSSQQSKWLWGALGGVSFLAIPVSLFLGVASGAAVHPVVGFVPPVLAAVAFAFFCYQFFQSSRTDVDNRRYELPTQLLGYLAADMSPHEPLEIEIDFNNYHQPQFCTTPADGGWFATVRTSSYAQPWLKLRGKLLDGNRFRLEATLEVKRKEKPKRKYTKVREQLSEALELVVHIRSGADLAQIADGLLNMRPPPQVAALQPRLAGDRLTLQADTAAGRRVQGRGGAVDGADALARSASVHAYLALFLAAYHVINQAGAAR